MNPTPNPKRDAALVDLYKAGRSLGQIAELFGITRQRVHQIITRDGVVCRPKSVRGKRYE